MKSKLLARNSSKLGPFEGIVDKIIVLSLPDADERRGRLPKHLAEFGISDFEWHDAFKPEHPKVQVLFEQGLVATFPPCFRCGKDRCNCENNVLISSQVANFASYLDIWQKVSRSKRRTLILEDDVLLHPWTSRITKRLNRKIKANRITFDPKIPMLLRMGWAKSYDHKPRRRVRVTRDVRMSNPCHAMTPAFAQLLLDRFTRVETTSDIFVHKKVADSKTSKTIFPPIASDLSWSEGSVDSHIHPKENRLDFLAKHAGSEEQAAHEQKLRRHVKRIFFRPLLCVGHPRTGTGFVAELCKKSGLDVGHEAGGADGISSWMFAVDAEENPWAMDPVARTRRALHWEIMIQTVRDPKTAIPSIMRENKHAPVSYDFRRDHIKAETGIDLDDFETETERAIVSLCLWARIIRSQNPDFVFRIEHDSERFIDFLLGKGFDVSKNEINLKPVNAEKLYKGVHYEKPNLAETDWGNISPTVKDLLQKYCELYGYKVPVIAKN